MRSIYATAPQDDFQTVVSIFIFGDLIPETSVVYVLHVLVNSDPIKVEVDKNILKAFW